ncbi:diaminopimelate decarboxylase [candidate division WOR-1 bacterium RIFOXYA12_FULL_52_29]|uniref:Diaminopimelate decarboxylase n=1 Tax=candidate division WOR-1 bacterium RIFOXYC12_FULL_54_18 TaxID=1802584 RepID=A0A1F4T847_UNCSA|nr:MAG: diaminopimelate decarboxylase [candidate division WOR-1 bacterium RIFOXYA2_FULL_51_19]OGC18457.1 MAG: diaminopimelate decarboxylase [candidate division WOR-1 bacterium RIFOXYA12_FULL_52_29]OGC27311.1 MAG: diaminopimelate decarboxylase [candidate division WOR-1 bacterium RIFOXYB2_FULL_45_9]OGC28874.1 MAG: diaminopimelate decarboxylase [candidate division WOR-1 bacterium RIFOXYC12_FULL_54_18]OGC29387.1 MAG: diaminopimelate decarboxylase [candidate division WOR-1 bacterium RIFOXYB12_FULL_5
MPKTAKINASGHLEIGGRDLLDLAKEFGTPLYLLDEETIRGQCRTYVNSFREHYPNSEIIFASKALCAIGAAKVIASEGLGFDVSSGGELFTVLKAKADPRRIYFHGNNKSIKEIEEGLKAGVGRFVVDNQYELANLADAADRLGRDVSVLIRINPGIEAHTHEFIQTGRIDSKFGVPLDQLDDLVKEVGKRKRLKLAGFHAHIGSQIFDVEPFIAEAKLLVSLTRKYGTEELSLGGGIGIPYLSGEKAPDIPDFARKIAAEIGKTNAKLILEPGRSIVGLAGMTLYTVGAVRDIPGVRKYLIVDGGMSDNPRFILYQAKYEAFLARDPGGEKSETVTIGGRFCESGDLVIKDGLLPPAKVGDVLAIACTGAYNYSMASNYNRVPRPAMVMVGGGKAKIIVKREQYKDLIINDAD